MGALAAAGADWIWQSVRHDATKGPKPPTDTGEIVGAAITGGALAGLWSWMGKERR